MFAMVTATSDDISFSSDSNHKSYCNDINKADFSIKPLYDTAHIHSQDPKLIKSLLISLRNKLNMLDNTIEISFESITTKIN